MKNALSYLTRRCPRKCTYCLLRDGSGVGPEMSVEQWVRAFEILKEMDCTFNLILGNEPWLLGETLLDILRPNKVPYALYTTCPSNLFKRYRELYFGSGVIDNLSCGIDFPISMAESAAADSDDSVKKSRDAWRAFAWMNEHYPEIDKQGTITIHKKNIHYVEELARDLHDIGAYIGIMFLHWDKDGGYDFFPPASEMEEYMFKPGDERVVEETMQRMLQNPDWFHHPEFMELPGEVLTGMGWHCKGEPTGGPNIDADGTLRVCGYRKGTRCPKLTIFDLPKREDDWKEAVYLDAMDCPGCCWSYPWAYRYWKDTDPEMGVGVYVKHAGTFIPEDKWAKRAIDPVKDLKRRT